MMHVENAAAWLIWPASSRRIAETAAPPWPVPRTIPRVGCRFGAGRID
jgi:hypothetical protein